MLIKTQLHIICANNVEYHLLTRSC